MRLTPQAEPWPGQDAGIIHRLAMSEDLSLEFRRKPVLLPR
jgi:hypothetical protein